MASACIRSNILNTNRTNNNNNSNNLTLPSIQNNQNFIIISQSNFNQITQQQITTMPVQKLKNLTTIAPAPTSSTSTTNSILGMNSINIQSNQSNNIQQSNNCGVSGSNINGTVGIYKKKYTYANIPYGTELPPSVARRNARERNRVKQVNNGYANLRQHIPQTIITALTNGGRGASKKLSKVDTLRLAVEYIRRLQDVLIDDGVSDNGSDGGSLYNSGSSNISSVTDCEGSPQSTTYYHNVESPINDNNNHHHQQQQQQQYVNHNGQMTNGNNDYLLNQIGYSDASASPAPSYTSEVSIGSDHKFEYLTSQQTNLEQHQQIHQHHQNNNIQFKFEPYDNSYNSITDTTQEDEELLDYISSWQDQ